MRGVKEGAAVIAFVVIVAASSLVVSKPAHADLFQALAGPNTGCSASGPTPVMVACPNHGFASFGTGDAFLSANANLGGVGAAVSITLVGIPLISQKGVFEASALELVSYTFPGPSAAHVNVRMNLTTTGDFSGGCPAGWGCGGNYFADLKVSNVPIVSDIDFDLQDGGFLADPRPVNHTLKSEFFPVVGGESFAFTYSLRVTAAVNNFSAGGLGLISSNFSTTFGPARTGPVFDLPEGFTAFGPCVENNRFVCADHETPGPVPAPGSLALLTLGLAGFAAWRWGRG